MRGTWGKYSGPGCWTLFVAAIAATAIYWLITFQDKLDFWGKCLGIIVVLMMSGSVWLWGVAEK